MSEEHLSVKTPPAYPHDGPDQYDDAASARDAIVRIVSAKPIRSPEYPAPQNTSRRDWASAIELVHEACEAIRLAEERADAAEKYSRDLAQYSGEQAKLADQKISALEKRLDNAEARASDAEDWLLRFHDAIVKGFGGVLKPR